jgi:hypothetical protein
MTTVQIVNSILVFILPMLVGLVYLLAQFQIQRMPVHQRGALEQFSGMAVRYVEHEHIRADKKALATAYATDLFRLSGLPVPHEDVLEIAIGAAFYEIEQMKI